jgi:hypothetical protein
MDAWASLLTRKGVDHHMRRAHQTILHRGRRLDREPFLHQRGIETAAKSGEYRWEHTMSLGAIHLDRSDPKGVHHGHVGP